MRFKVFSSFERRRSLKAIARWDDLTPYGIEPLTGEACGLMYRILCDVTQHGNHVLEKCLGIPHLALPSPWNRGSDSDPHVGSIMLAPEMLVPIAVFALLEAGCTEVWKVGDSRCFGIEANDPPDTVATLKRCRGTEGLRRFAYQGTAGDRNIHVISGRVL